MVQPHRNAENIHLLSQVASRITLEETLSTTRYTLVPLSHGQLQHLGFAEMDLLTFTPGMQDIVLSQDQISFEEVVCCEQPGSAATWDGTLDN
jgi:hypothetical protein